MKTFYYIMFDLLGLIISLYAIFSIISDNKTSKINKSNSKKIQEIFTKIAEVSKETYKVIEYNNNLLKSESFCLAIKEEGYTLRGIKMNNGEIIINGKIEEHDRNICSLGKIYNNLNYSIKLDNTMYELLEENLTEVKITLDLAIKQQDLIENFLDINKTIN